MSIENVSTALKAIPQKKRKGVAMMYIKTMTNSWFTSRPLANAGVPQLNCIFGCEDCADDLSHYLQCQVIWCLVCSAMKLDSTWASLDGIDRVGFPDPDPIHLYTVCIMFKCYYAIRNDYATTFRKFTARLYSWLDILQQISCADHFKGSEHCTGNQQKLHGPTLVATSK